jgi:hypothetical protein
VTSALPPKRAFVCSVALAIVAVLPAAAQVYKCTDRNGHVTYQQEPCSGALKGGAVELTEPVTVRPGANANEALWSAAAREGRAIVGMPKTFVTEALGRAAEIRTPRAGEAGTEVWVYPKAGQVTRIGFQNNAVAWIRSDAIEAPAKPGVPAAPDREARVRQALVVGRPCDAALSEAGPADREEPLTVGAQGGAVQGGGTRYVYTFDGSNVNAYAAFVCVGGRVTGVERYIPGK